MKLSFVKRHISKVDSRLIPGEEDSLFRVDRFIPTATIPSGQHTITWITNSYVHRTLGGSEYMAHMINKYLLGKGYSVNVIGNWDTEVYEGVQLINIRDTSLVHLAIGKACILFSQNYTFPELTARIAGRLGKHVVVFLHTTIIDWDPPPYSYQHHMDSDKLHIVYNTAWVKEYFASSLQSIIVRPPTDTLKIPTHTTKQYVTLITTTPGKGGYQLIEIAKRLPHVQFLGVGNHGVQDTTISNIKYIPNTRTIREIYEQSSIVLMPSAYESWGMVASEAICGGIPVIASPTPGLKENLGYAGIFVPQHSIQEWVDAIQKLLTDSEYYQTVSQQCRKRGDELLKQNKDEFEEMYTFIRGITNN